MKNQTIQWVPKLVNVKDIKPTPNNYKIKTDLGKERLQTSLKLFGLAGTVIVNTDLTLIDGNSRLIQAKERGEKKVYVSMPNRKLTPKEFTEMSAMYDFAKAGEVDIDRIKGELGTTADMYKRWGLAVPAELLENRGAKAKNLRSAGTLAKVGGVSAPEKISTLKDEMTVTLFFTEKEESEFRKLENKLRGKLKTVNTTQTVLKAMKAASK